MTTTPHLARASNLPELAVPGAPAWGRFSFAVARDGGLELVRGDDGRAVLAGVRWPTDDRGMVRGDHVLRGLFDVGVVRLAAADLEVLEGMALRFPGHDYRLTVQAGRLRVRPCGEASLLGTTTTTAAAQLERLVRRV